MAARFFSRRHPRCCMKERHEAKKSSCFTAVGCGKNERIEDNFFIFADF
jgi:hypothetical protein